MTERQGRRRQRSLRVPVDDVPRRPSEPDAVASAELEMLMEPETDAPKVEARPRTAPPPPPPRRVEDDTGALDGAFSTSLDGSEARTTDPGLEEAPSGDVGEEEADLGRPMDGSEPSTELESEPTQVAVELEDGGGFVPPAEAEARRDDDDAPDGPTTGSDLESHLGDGSDLGGSDPEIEAARVDVSGSDVPGIPAERTREIDVATAAPTGPGVVISSPGVIVVGRTIAIGVGTPTFTTTAEERASAPPDPPVRSSHPPPVDPDAEVAIDVPPSPATPSPATPSQATPLDDGSPRAEEIAEELGADELEEASSPSISVRPRSVPPRAAAPPPPGAAPPPRPSGQRSPPKPPKAPPAALAAAPAAPPTPAAASAAPIDADTAKRARRKWWEDLFNDDYLRTVPIPHPKVILRQTDFIEARLGLQKGATILDVGCGLGLHAIELTRRGYFVVGLDLSLPMLSRAADEARDQELKINFVQGDMREMSFDGAFDAVLSWGTSFGYFDDDGNRAVIERFHRALKPGGLLLLDVVNRDHMLRTQPNNCWFQGDGCVVMEETQLNYITSRLTAKRQVMLDDGRQLDTAYSIRMYSLHELGQILHTRGFRVVEVSGLEATPNVFFGAESPRLLIVAERRVDATPSKAPPAPGETGQLAAVRDGEPTPGEPPAAPSTPTSE